MTASAVPGLKGICWDPVKRCPSSCSSAEEGFAEGEAFTVALRYHCRSAGSVARALAPPDNKARGLLEDEDTSSSCTGAACSA